MLATPLQWRWPMPPSPMAAYRLRAALGAHRAQRPMASRRSTKTARSPCRTSRKFAATCAQVVKAIRIEVVRHGLWKVVNEAGGTGERKGADQRNRGRRQDRHARRPASAARKRTSLGFAVSPRTTIPNMWSSSWCRAANTAAAWPAPWRTHILEQCLAMDQGTSTSQLAALKPAHNPPSLQRDRRAARLHGQGAGTWSPTTTSRLAR